MRLRKHLIKEGGNAIKSSSNLNSENYKGTIGAIASDFIPKLGVRLSEVHIIGSGGKKAPGQTYGDIDLALSYESLLKSHSQLKTIHDAFEFVSNIAKKHSHEVFEMKNNGIVSLAWPIENRDGKQEGQFVQVDLMLVDDLDWADWTYHAPQYYESKYKGLYRNILLFTIAKVAFLNVTKTVDTLAAEWEKLSINLAKGLLKQVQTNLSKITGKQIKSKRTLSSEVLTRDPEKAVKLLLGPKFTVADTATFESTLKAILSKDFIHADKRKQILNAAKQDYESQGFPIPKEMNR